VVLLPLSRSEKHQTQECKKNNSNLLSSTVFINFDVLFSVHRVFAAGWWVSLWARVVRRDGLAGAAAVGLWLRWSAPDAASGQPPPRAIHPPLAASDRPPPTLHLRGRARVSHDARRQERAGRPTEHIPREHHQTLQFATWVQPTLRRLHLTSTENKSDLSGLEWCIRLHNFSVCDENGSLIFVWKLCHQCSFSSLRLGEENYATIKSQH